MIALETLDSFVKRAESILATARPSGNTEVKLDQDVKEGSVAAARDAYSRDRQRRVIYDVAGDGSTFEFDLTAAGWDLGISVLIRNRVEYPKGENPPVYLTDSQFYLYEDADANDDVKVVLRTLVTPATGDSIRIPFTAPHLISGMSSATRTTIPSSDREAFAHLVAHYLALACAAERLKLGDSIAGQESLDLTTKSAEWKEIAGEMKKKYDEQLTPSEDDAPPHGVATRFTDANPRTGQPFLTHRRRYS